MTGKRARSLSRTVSVSQLRSTEFSDAMLTKAMENVKPSVMNKQQPVSASPGPRVVVGFDLKPCGGSAPCSPSFNEKVASPRSVLNSLLSRHPRVAKASDGVGLGIALATESSPIVVPVHQRRHSHPIPTVGSGARSERKMCNEPRHVVGWMEASDTFLLVETPVGARGSILTKHVKASHFLDECSFCKRQIPEDKDIFMYRGDKAFCSFECREQKMILDERSKGCSFQGSSMSRSPCGPASFVAAA